ncbi:RNase H family protein [Candidatus Uabimicrobium sp. HlEnr_7]|uniref:ribonuclease HI n=1 Tax=Candidatus Uabimicrobium helgolandensis TaxID=3095367 RepID=UPI0035586246
MPWVRKKFKKCKVYTLVDAQGQIVIENNLAQIKYRNVEDDKVYNARLDDIQDIPEENKTEQNKTEQNKTEQNKTEQNKTEQNKTEYSQKKDSSNNKDQPTTPGSVTQQIEIYTDGACTGNPGPAGIGVFFSYGAHKKEISEYIGHATNNIAELKAIKKALESLKNNQHPVTIFTDSQYALSVLNGAYKAKKNKELIKSIQEIMKNFKYLQMKKVAGHAGIPGNEKADQLAVAAIENSKNE